MKHIVPTALAVFAAACSGGHEPTTPVCVPTVTTSVTFTGGAITAEIAATGGARDTGLMNRPMLGAESGMLFVFPADQPVTGFAPFFWMKNTLFDLSIAFVDASRHVIEIQDMVARDTITQHRPQAPYRYALEANRGWFASHGVASGAVAGFTLSNCTVISQ